MEDAERKLYVTSYWDRHLRVWTVMLVNSEGGIIGNIEYAHTREELDWIREKYKRMVQDVADNVSETCQKIMRNYAGASGGN